MKHQVRRDKKSWVVPRCALNEYFMLQENMIYIITYVDIYIYIPGTIVC